MYSAHPSKQNHAWWLDTCWLALIIGIIFFLFLGSRALFVPDEGRYAEIAREMVVSNDYLTPHLNAIKYFEKPVLFYWLEALAIKLGGLNLWSIRSINALLGLMGCLCAYYTARILYDRSTGLLAGFILGSSLLYGLMARMITLDMPVTFFLSATMYFFILAITKPKFAHYFFWGAAINAALATLTKGLIGIVFPILIVSIWLSLSKKWRIVKTIPFFSCFIIFFLLVLPWHLSVAKVNPEFFHFYFIEQHFLRYTSKAIGHYQPSWYFIPVLFLGFFPWILFLPQALLALVKKYRYNRREYLIDLFFVVWFMGIFLFFSFSKSKLIPYILPIFPPLAIFIARHIRTTIWQKWHRALTHLIILTLISSLTFFLLFPHLDKRSIRPLALQLQPLLKPGDEVMTLNQYYQDLPFYLERRITIVNWRNELEFGMRHQDTQNWMIGNETFWQRWKGSKRVFVVLNEDELKVFKKSQPLEKYYILAKSLKTILLSNRP